MMPIEGRYYWVRRKGSEWFIVLRSEKAGGGWTNLDTWEDWDNEIIQWELIDLPKGGGI